MLPQLYMFQKQASDEGGSVEPLTGTFYFSLFLIFHHLLPSFFLIFSLHPTSFPFLRFLSFSFCISPWTLFDSLALFLSHSLSISRLLLFGLVNLFRISRILTHLSVSLKGHTVFALAFARVFELVFWAGSFSELKGFSGYLILISQFAHLAVMADFFYYYAISISRGSPMELPTHSSLA